MGHEGDNQQLDRKAKKVVLQRRASRSLYSRMEGQDGKVLRRTSWVHGDFPGPALGPRAFGYLSTSFSLFLNWLEWSSFRSDAPCLSLFCHIPQAHHTLAPHGELLRPQTGHSVCYVLPNSHSRLVNPSDIQGGNAAPLWSLPWLTLASSSIVLHTSSTTTTSHCLCFHVFLLHGVTNADQPEPGTVSGTKIFSNCLLYVETELKSPQSMGYATVVEAPTPITYWISWKSF